LRDAIAGPKLRSGKPIYSPLAIDPYLDQAVRYPAYPRYPLIWGVSSHIFTSPPTVCTDMMVYLLKSDLDEEYAKGFATTEVYKRSSVEFTNADSPNLDAFMRHGGKLILFAGAADQVFSSVDAASYQNELFDRYGREKTDAFSQLFIIPGFGHVLPYTHSVSYVDLIAAIVDWAENSKSPDGLMATALKETDWPGRTRPVCAYPKIPIYGGTGSIEDGRNFSCR
jgi:feruloyl esterase